MYIFFKVVLTLSCCEKANANKEFLCLILSLRVAIQKEMEPDCLTSIWNKNSYLQVKSDYVTLILKPAFILQVDDTYKTVGLKLLASFNWINNLNLSKLKWIVKLDDDIIFNLYQLDKYLSSPNVTRNGDNFIHCKVNNGIPMRDINQKW